MSSTPDMPPVSGLANLRLSVVPTVHPHFTSRGTDWSDQAAVHRSVMGLFAQKLPGPEDRRRAEAGVLYRLEDRRSDPRILIQSTSRLQRHDHGIRTTTLEGLARYLRRDARIVFRLDLNAVRSQSRTRRRVPVPIEDVPALLLHPASTDRPGLLAGALHQITVQNIETTKRLMGSVPLHVASLSGTAAVADPATLANVIAAGIGRAKSYGCGLLSVHPL